MIIPGIVLIDSKPAIYDNNDSSDRIILHLITALQNKYVCLLLLMHEIFEWFNVPDPGKEKENNGHEYETKG